MEDEEGRSGSCPINHLNPTPREAVQRSNNPTLDLGANSSFPPPSWSQGNPGSEDIGAAELSSLEWRGTSRTERKVQDPVKDLKGFDPLCSPDEEIAQLETELINKVQVW